jgi:hypothetical protein
MTNLKYNIHEGLTNLNDLNRKGNSSIDKMPHVESTDFDSGLIPPDITKNVSNTVSPNFHNTILFSTKKLKIYLNLNLFHFMTNLKYTLYYNFSGRGVQIF